MSHPDFKDKGTPLGRFVEECGECLHAAGKTLRFGMDYHNPLVPENMRITNREWLKLELADLKEAIEKLEKTL